MVIALNNKGCSVMRFDAKRKRVVRTVQPFAIYVSAVLSKLLDALVVLASTGINADTVTCVDEERHLNGCTGVYSSRLE